MTPNQVVAHNLRAARDLRGWSQEVAAQELEPYLGERWSTVTYSAAERSITGRRVRQFNADEIVAFAQTFDLPVAWFLLPPAASNLVVSANPDPPPQAVLGWMEILALLFTADGAPLRSEIDGRVAIAANEQARAEFLGVLRDHVAALTNVLVDELTVTSDLQTMSDRLRLGATIIDALNELTGAPTKAFAEMEDER